MSVSPDPFTAEQRRELGALPRLNGLPDDRLVAVTHRQISLMSTLPMGSVGLALSKAELKPAYPGSNVFAVRELRAFCAKHAAATAQRLAGALVLAPAADLADPKAAADAFLAQLLAQARQP